MSFLYDFDVVTFVLAGVIAVAAELLWLTTHH